METIKVKYFSEDVAPLEYVDGKSDWIDLCAAQEVTLRAGEFRLIPLGVAMELPAGYEAHIAPRSSTFKNYGILQTNGVGVVDSDYRGELKVPMVNLGREAYTIQPGERVAQLCIAPVYTAAFVPAEELGDTQRGEGGFGSTGK